MTHIPIYNTPCNTQVTAVAEVQGPHTLGCAHLLVAPNASTMVEIDIISPQTPAPVKYLSVPVTYIPASVPTVETWTQQVWQASMAHDTHSTHISSL